VPTGRGEPIAWQGRTRAYGVTLRIGPLSGVVPELLRAANPVPCVGTIAAGAQLLIEEMPVRVRCRARGAETRTVVNRLACEACGDPRTQLLGGDETLLASVGLTY